MLRTRGAWYLEFWQLELVKLGVWCAFGANFEVIVLKLYEELGHEQGITS